MGKIDGVEALTEAVRAGSRIKYLHFWGHRPRRDGRIGAGCLSQWWPSPFAVDGVSYATAEHWMMAGKARLFGDAEAERRVLAAGHPAEAKKVGREVRGFDGKIWERERFRIVVEGNVHKFAAHDDLRLFLLNTGDRVLVEASPVDRVWGIGLAADDEAASDPERWRGLSRRAEDQPGPVEDVRRADVVRVRCEPASDALELRLSDARPGRNDRGSAVGLRSEVRGIRTGGEMSDSIEWLGGHCFEKPMGGPGMRGGVSLTAVRGLPVEDLLRRMGAGDDQIGIRTQYRDFDRLSVDAPWTPCMYGTSGEWSYVLEDSGVCAWYQHWADGNSSVIPGKGEEFLCLHANVAVQPSWLFYSSGEGDFQATEFRHSLTGPAPDGVSSRAHLLNSRMRSNGAVWPDPDQFSSPETWRAFVEQSSAGLHAAVWRSVGEHTGLKIPRGAVESGDLPVALLPDPFI